MTSLWMVYALVICGITYVAAALVEHVLWLWRGPRRAAWVTALVASLAAPVTIPFWRAEPHPSARRAVAAAIS